MVKIPTASRTWHPAAKKWYASLAKSGQSIYYEPSDWATAFILAETMSRELKPRHVGFSETVDKKTGQIETKPVSVAMPINGTSMGALLKGMGVLMCTEGERRRAHLELDRPDPNVGEEDNVSWLDTARERRSS